MKVDQYARSRIAFSWRVEQTATGIPLTYTDVLDQAAMTYRDGEIFTGTVKVSAPFPADTDLGTI